MRRATWVAVREILVQAFRPEAAVVHRMSRPSAYAYDASFGDTDFNAASYWTDSARGGYPPPNLYFVLLW